MSPQSPWRRLSRREIYREAKRRLRGALLHHWHGKRRAFEQALRSALRRLSRGQLLRVARRPAVLGLLVSAVAAGSSIHADTIELSDIALDSNDGGFTMEGISTFVFAGTSVSRVGDLNGDGLSDFAVGAPLSNINGTSSGTTFVVFGKAGGTEVDLANIVSGIGGFAIHGRAYSQSGNSVAAAGDVNGDELSDLVIGAPTAAPNGSTSGAAYVVFGKSSGTAVDLTNVAMGTGGFVINGAAATDRAGEVVSGSGDINGDGLSDVVVGAYRMDSNGSDSGAAFVVFGKANGNAVELSTLTGASLLGFQIRGVSAGDLAGWGLAGAGDINGDDLDDVVVGAPYDEALGANGGAAYVVFGKSTVETVDLSSLLTGTSTAGFAMLGDQSGVRTGKRVSGAGDVNGDGLIDVIVGAPYAAGSVYSSGVSYVVFGKADGAVVDLGAVMAGAGGFAIQGAASGDQAARCANAGDVNGDGLTDLIIGAPQAAPNGNASGKAYVVFGKPDGDPIDLSDVEADGSLLGFALNGALTSDRAGSIVARAGDVNGDGFPDVLVGAPNATRDSNYTGVAYVVFGRPSDRTAWVDFAYLGPANGKFLTPFKTLTGAANAVPAVGTVKIKGDTGVSTSSESLTIENPMTILAVNGHVRIGVP